MSATVRDFQASDVAFIQSWLADFNDRAYSASELLTQSQQPHYRIRCAVLANQGVAGFCLFNLVAEECNLLYVAVDPGQRHRGIGKLLLGDLLDQCGQQSIEAIYLEVRASNAAAIGLYQAMGFALVGRRANYYPAIEQAGVATTAARETALLYQCSLR